MACGCRECLTFPDFEECIASLGGHCVRSRRRRSAEVRRSEALTSTMPAPTDDSSLTLLTQGALDRARLGNVRKLNLWTDKIHDLSRLRRAPLLEKLVLDETSVSDLSPLAGAPNLGELHLYDNPDIEDLSP